MVRHCRGFFWLLLLLCTFHSVSFCYSDPNFFAVISGMHQKKKKFPVLLEEWNDTDLSSDYLIFLLQYAFESYTMVGISYVLKNRIVLYLPWFQCSFYPGPWTTNTVFRAAGKSMNCPLELYSACVRAHISECDNCHCQSFRLYIENFTEKIIPPKKLI